MVVVDHDAPPIIESGSGPELRLQPEIALMPLSVPVIVHRMVLLALGDRLRLGLVRVRRAAGGFVAEG